MLIFFMEIKKLLINFSHNVGVNVRLLVLKVKNFCFIKSFHQSVNDLIFYLALAFIGYLFIRLLIWITSSIFQGIVLSITIISIIICFILI